MKEDRLSARRLRSSGSRHEAGIGYSRAVVQGDWVFVSGTTGFDYTTMRIADAVEEPAEQCLRNIDAALGAASPHISHRSRMIAKCFARRARRGKEEW